MSAAELDLETDVGAHAVTVVVTGELDLSTNERLHQHLGWLLSDGATRAVELDLAGVSFMDSTSLATLVTAHRLATENDRTLRVVDASDAVRRLLETTGISALVGLPDR